MRKVIFPALLVCLLLSVVLVPAYAQDTEHTDDVISRLILRITGSVNATLVVSVAGALLGVGIAWFIARRSRYDVKLIHYGVVALTLVTAIIHILIGIGGEWLLLANGIGYIVLLLACYLPLPRLGEIRRPLAALLMLYTLVTIAGYFLTHSQVGILALVTKVVEVALVLSLIIVIVRFPFPQSYFPKAIYRSR